MWLYLKQHKGLLVLLLLAMASARAEKLPLTFSLQQAIDQALADNAELGVMQARIAEAEARFGESLASFYPQIKASLSYQHSDNPAQAFAMIIAQRRLNFAGGDFNHPGGVDDYRPQVTASYALFRGGQDYYRQQAAALGVENTALETAASRHHLINNVTAAYYAYLAAEDAHQLNLRGIEAVDSELRQSRIKYAAGTVLKSDVLSLEVQLAEAKDQELQSGNGIELAKAMLKTLLGLNADQDFSIDSHGNYDLPATPQDFDTLLTQASARHPALQAAEKRVAVAEQQLNMAQATHLPRADAFVSYGSNSKDLAFSSNRDNLTAGVMVEVDVFSGFATQEKVHQAEHALTAAKENARQVRLQIEQQVKTARLKLLEALNRQQVTVSGLQAAEEALRLVNEQRQAGVVTVTRYLEAEVARDKAKTREISARYDALRAEADLKQATGFWN